MNKFFDFTNFNVDNAKEHADEIYNDGNDASVSHDDGFMHVSFKGKRYGFYIGQDCLSSQYNRTASLILGSIGIIGKVTGHNN